MRQINKTICRLALTITFGRNSPQPFKTAIMRIVAAMLLSLGLGSLTALALKTTPISHDTPPFWLALALAIVSYILTSLVFMSVTLAQGHSTQQTSVMRISRTWPLKNRSLWELYMIPKLLVWLIILVFCIPILVVLSEITNLIFPGILASWLFGSLAGLGYVLGAIKYPVIFKGLGFIAVSTILLHLLATSLTEKGGYIRALIAVLLLASCYLGFWLNYRLFLKSTVAVVIKNPRFVLPTRLLEHYWFLMKVIRNQRTIQGFLFSLMISISIATAIYIRHLAEINYWLWLIVGGILSGAFAADIRGLSRRYKTAEIFCFKGTSYMLSSQFVSTYILALVINLPLLLIMLAFSPWLTIAPFICIQFAAVAVGLLASSIFVPQTGEPGSQFMSAALSTILIFGAYKLIGMLGLVKSSTVEGFSWILYGLICYILMSIIENYRKRNYGYTRTT